MTCPEEDDISNFVEVLCKGTEQTSATNIGLETSDGGNEGTGMAGAAIAGIVLAVFAVLGIAGAGLAWWHRQRGRRQEDGGDGAFGRMDNKAGTYVAQAEGETLGVEQTAVAEQ
jgi:hypothetical protein